MNQDALSKFLYPQKKWCWVCGADLYHDEDTVCKNTHRRQRMIEPRISDNQSNDVPRNEDETFAG